MKDDETTVAVAVPGSIHSGINTPLFLSGTALSIWNAKLQLQRFLLLLCGAVLTVLITVQVFTRYVMSISLFGIEELASFVAVYLYFIGASHGAWERGHISASLVELVVPEGRTREAIAAFASLITLLLCGWMTLWAWQYLAFTLKRGTMSLETGIPMVWVHGVMPVCLTLMTVYFAVELLDHLRRFGRGGGR
ncbi:TRAP transporter small permease subunit [Mesorhizobium sp.]|uniref:TRAP transporter small permease n=1 Tax=Mesorhizobium sp. TaxID=1871066 RepID=UPI00122B4ACB|nr:TRAP transporter small permease subunit [Mesorhizobium sp.]TIO06428.1 MAG: TRAP transporter small permease [Mesorhizobium sp.]TIO32657.1 MAG: TRAP transporter small permease [Mesorhizobium sp.]TIP08977.1 MAG: TRAP transporter small permease [Mesorhizobium sp.]